jgi:hypothetical protein
METLGPHNGKLGWQSILSEQGVKDRADTDWTQSRLLLCALLARPLLHLGRASF